MSSTMSRNQREGRYAGCSRGTHSRHHALFRFTPCGYMAAQLRIVKDQYLIQKDVRAGLKSIAKRLAAEGLTVTGRAVAYIPEMQNFPLKRN